MALVTTIQVLAAGTGDAGLDGPAGEERRELLYLLLEGATIDAEYRVTLTLLPVGSEFVPIAEPEPSYRSSNPHQALLYSWGVNLPPPHVAARRTSRGGASLISKAPHAAPSSPLSS